MKHKMITFSFTAISIVVLASFLGLTSAAKPEGDATATCSTTWDPIYVPSPTGGQVNVVVTNTGGVAIGHVRLEISGGTVSYFYTKPGWSLSTPEDDTAVWSATGKSVIGKNDYSVFQFTWEGPYNPGFAGYWTVFDRKGNPLDQGSFSWHYP